ncbi:hypothetical protein BJ508DRAFT_380556 [Ascobolus immersus RN42]|uniref:Uncharacterized protein n=1 Tax=Ascobolus immersus RN42 TaxID=1160509 RepID=A0A3N4HRU8_ASCIM|nr:hypothetical protein BJ508DRAFT_380556 [Ascobolus immersus RN42]
MALCAIPPPVPSSHHPFPLLPHERILHTSPPRITVTLHPSTLAPSRNTLDPITFPTTGRLHLTNLRILFLTETYHTTPTTTPSYKSPNSFVIPLICLKSRNVYLPWFGANEWHANVVVLPQGGIDEVCFPAPEGFAGVERGVRAERVRMVEVKARFSEGGVGEWHEAVEQKMRNFVVGEEGRGGEGLPAYGGPDGGAVPVPVSGEGLRSAVEDPEVVDGMHGPAGSPGLRNEDAPPGYDEVVR